MTDEERYDLCASIIDLARDVIKESNGKDFKFTAQHIDAPVQTGNKRIYKTDILKAMDEVRRELAGKIYGGEMQKIDEAFDMVMEKL